MSASKRFRFSEWRNSLAPPDNSLIEINDDLSIEFDESQNSSTCEILIKNYGYRKITIAGVQYERLLLQLTHEPESGAIEPFGFVNYSFKAIHFTDRRISSAVVRFLFADHDQKVITRTISVSYNNNARNTGMNILNRTKFFYDIPQVFIEATDPTLQPSKINDLVDALVPAFNEMIYENYQAHFHGLLYLEEIAIKREYEHLVRKNVAFRENGNYFEVDFKHSQRLLLGIGDKITAFHLCIDDRSSYKGTIVNIKVSQGDCTKLTIHFESKFKKTFKYLDYTIIIQPNRAKFIRTHKAIDIVKATFGKDSLFPSTIESRTRSQLDVELDSGNLVTNGIIIPWFNSQLNPSQQMAVKSVLRAECPKMPYVINGPPGTGKTTTVIEILLQLFTQLPKSRILIATQSNAAADVILKRLISCARLDSKDVIRIVSFNFASKVAIDNDTGMYHAVLSTDRSEGFEIPPLPCKSLAELTTYRVIITTTLTAGNFLESACIMHHFTHALIDEAGQCSEMEAAIPQALIGENGKLVLIGDPLQMPPMCINPICKRLGLEVSMLGRMLLTYDLLTDSSEHSTKYDRRVATQLMYNYRSLPSILNFYNEQFYGMELIPQLSSVHSREAKMLGVLCNGSLLPENNSNHGIYFRNVCGRQKRIHGTSPCNLSEAEEILAFVKKLGRAGIGEDIIGIVTPYALQVNLLKAMFASDDLNKVKIGTVEEFQGDERHIILVSMVRTLAADTQIDADRRLGFIKCANRINVVASRARLLLYVFGCEKIVCMDAHWKALVDKCKEMGTYFANCKNCQNQGQSY